ncbi:membrane-binding protein [Chryseobacterium sp.]|uniref:membrane-binding protein n=1 Tax=Chryseobacterium sp. TaxID=1871047 RepID=UPI003890315B
MNLKSLLVATTIGVYSLANAQQIIYFNEDWEVTTKDKMEYYRETTKQGNLTLVKDFYKNGTPQMQGLASDSTPNAEVWDGQVTWYYPNGKVQTTSNFKNGTQMGISKGFDENGRVLEDMVYDKDINFRGTRYAYKDDYGTYNSITEYEKSEPTKEVVYDEDKDKIRYETVYTNGYEATETKYYDERGKYIGTKYSKDYVTSGVVVEYYYQPMKVKSISKYGKDESIVEEKLFYKNGKVAKEKKLNKKDGVEKTYDVNGVKIAELAYALDKDSNSLSPADGVSYDFSEDLDTPIRIATYAKGMLVSEKTYNEETKRLSSEVTYKDGENDKLSYYDDNGNLRSTLQYKDGMPYNGNIITNNSETVFSDGKVQTMKITDQDGKIFLEKKYNLAKNIYEAKIYNMDQKMIMSYTSDPESDLLNGVITQYENGKAVRKATIKDDYLIDGKLSLKTDDQRVEREVSKKMQYYRVYNDKNVLIEETKKLKQEEDDFSELMYVAETSLFENFVPL